MIAGFGLGELGEAEVKNFGAAIFGDENVFWLQVAMDDAFFVRGSEAVGDLQRVVESLARGDRSAAQAVAQRLTLKQFRDNLGRTFTRADVEYRENVGMVQGCGGQRFLFESAQAVGVAGKSLRQNFDGYFAFKAGVAGAVDLTHPARAERGDNFVRTKFGARGLVHRAGL